MAKSRKKSGDTTSTPTTKTTRAKKGAASAAEARVNAVNPATVEAAIASEPATTPENVTLAAVASQAPPEEAIRRRAYEIYLERGGAPGSPLEDWARAERELRGS